MAHRNFWNEMKRKLCSRKFWVCVVGFVSGIMIQCGATQERIDNVGGSIMSGAALLAYCIGEGLADSENKKK